MHSFISNAPYLFAPVSAPPRLERPPRQPTYDICTRRIIATDACFYLVPAAAAFMFLSSLSLRRLKREEE
ncbi:hypothetical protein SODALDRAFT_361266 [Sodiomyces alkalinus F11]|uniref:Uncharacterized protein n=1 Tax=Sodiomyces alkalinus (strain CBS 110278 / VKM F-3762 / F11) TaxID=1314773 RepID=A0A3N2PSQ8_SODAK|nr:hypothetical protein SODALDRAFT_361266 [Sodiomyces alkalinus F11]ROT37551.1 hypothetical protein SODALDRAFT_361266 [Sodiomyces alkalinus F11]